MVQKVVGAKRSSNLIFIICVFPLYLVIGDCGVGSLNDCLQFLFTNVCHQQEINNISRIIPITRTTKRALKVSVGACGDYLVDIKSVGTGKISWRQSFLAAVTPKTDRRPGVVLSRHRLPSFVRGVGVAGLFARSGRRMLVPSPVVVARAPQRGVHGTYFAVGGNGLQGR